MYQYLEQFYQEAAEPPQVVHPLCPGISKDIIIYHMETKTQVFANGFIQKQ